MSTSPALELDRRTPRVAASASVPQTRGELIFWVCLVLAHLVPIWAFQYFPTDDGPAHRYNAGVLLDYSRPDQMLLREYYQVSHRPDPNWTGHLLLAGLMKLMSPVVAEKYLVTAYIVLIAMAIRYALGALGSGPAAMAVLGLPLIYNFTFQKGFFNFSLSLAGFFFIIGYWLRHESDFRPRHAAWLAVLAVATYFCHLVSVAMAAGVIGALAFGRTFSNPSLGRLRRVLLPMSAFLPSIMLAVLFLGQHHGGVAKFALFTKVMKLCLCYSMVLFDTREVIGSAVMAVLLGGAVLVLLQRMRRGHGGPWDFPFALCLLATVAVYFMSPDDIAGGGLMIDRLVLFPAFVAVLWIGVQSWSVMRRRLIMGVAVTVSLGMLVFHSIRIAQLNDFISEYAAAAAVIPSGTTVLPISFSDSVFTPEGRLLSSRIFPLTHAGGLIATRRGIVDLANYEASTGYFPVTFRPLKDAWRQIGMSHRLNAPPEARLDSFTAKTGGQIDYIVLWRGTSRVPEGAASIYRQLDGYQKIYVSPEHGYVEVYAHKHAPI